MSFRKDKRLRLQAPLRRKLQFLSNFSSNESSSEKYEIYIHSCKLAQQKIFIAPETGIQREAITSYFYQYFRIFMFSMSFRNAISQNLVWELKFRKQQLSETYKVRSKGLTGPFDPQRKLSGTNTHCLVLTSCELSPQLLYRHQKFFQEG